MSAPIAAASPRIGRATFSSIRSHTAAVSPSVPKAATTPAATSAAAGVG